MQPALLQSADDCPKTVSLLARSRTTSGTRAQALTPVDSKHHSCRLHTIHGGAEKCFVFHKRHFWGVIYSHDFITNLPLSVTMKWLLKIEQHWRSYGPAYSGNVLDSQRSVVHSYATLYFCTAHTRCAVRVNRNVRYCCFLPRDAMLARYMLSSCICLPVCPSVSLSVLQAGTVLKWLNAGSRWQRHTTAHGL